jgi:hypothetical protein
MAGKALLDVYCAADIVFAIIKFKNIDIIPHKKQNNELVRNKKADFVRRSPPDDVRTIDQLGANR